MSGNSKSILVALMALLVAMPVFGVGPTFAPDVTVQANSLNGWHTLGSARWRAENGEIVGTAQSGNSGWLVLDDSYQNVALFSSFRCTGGCQTGVDDRQRQRAAHVHTSPRGGRRRPSALEGADWRSGAATKTSSWSGSGRWLTTAPTRSPPFERPSIASPLGVVIDAAIVPSRLATLVKTCG